MKNSKPNQVSWEERFDKKFPIVDVHRKFRKDLSINVSAKWVPEGRQELKQFIRSLLKEERKKIQEAHLTEDGYCCACGYDIAYFETEINKLKSKLSKDEV